MILYVRNRVPAGPAARNRAGRQAFNWRWGSEYPGQVTFGTGKGGNYRQKSFLRRSLDSGVTRQNGRS